MRARDDPIALFALIPALRLAMDPVLAQLDQLLEDDALVQRVNADLWRRTPPTATRGRPSTPVEGIVRRLVVKRWSQWSDEETEQLVADRLGLRQFCRLSLEPVPDDTTLLRWANLIGAQTVAARNDRVVEWGRSLTVTRGRKLRGDRTVGETNIHHPTDGRRVRDGGHVRSRLCRRAKRVLPGGASVGQAVLRTRTRSVRRLAQHIPRLARRQGEEATAQRQRTSARWLAVARQSCAQAAPVRAALHGRRRAAARRVAQEVTDSGPLVTPVIRQAHRRVLDGDVGPAQEKSLSLVEPHTPSIQRHKPGKPVACGRKLGLDEVDGGLISRYAIVAEAGPEHPYLAASLPSHRQPCGRPPRLVAGDRGLDTPAHARLAERAGVKPVVLPDAGKASPQRGQHERASWCRRGCRLRAGLEGRISVLRRCVGLDRCREPGAAGLGRGVGWGIVTAHLVTSARTVADRSARRLSRAA